MTCSCLCGTCGNRRKAVDGKDCYLSRSSLFVNVMCCRPTQNVMSATPTPVTNPFGTLPAMPQITIGRSAGSGPSVQYGISSMPVCCFSGVPLCV